MINGQNWRFSRLSSQPVNQEGISENLAGVKNLEGKYRSSSRTSGTYQR